MSVINEAVEAVIYRMNRLPLFAQVTRGALPTGPGIVCEIGPSTPQEVYMDKGLYIPLDLTINAKHDNLYTLSEAMNRIHDELTRGESYPRGNEWKIVDIANYTLPQKLGRDEGGMWLMASSLSVRIYWEGSL